MRQQRAATHGSVRDTRVRAVLPTDPPATPPRRGVSTSGTDAGTPVRWALAFLAGGLLLLTIAGARRRVGSVR